MLERYTDRARRVIFFARYEAFQAGAGRIETQHLLLALFREDRDLMRRTVGSPVEVERIRRQLEEHFAGERSSASPADLLFSPEAQRAISSAHEEADHMGCRGLIGTGHLLLGLLREGKAEAARILNGYGVDLGRMRQQIAKSSDAPLARTAAGPAGTRGYTLEELERLVAAVPEARREAAGRVLEALHWDTVAIAVTSGEAAFSYTYRGPGGENGG